MKTFRKLPSALSLAIAVAIGAPTTVQASGETTGVISGSVIKAPAGAKNIEVRVFRADTGYEKRLTADAAGAFRFNQLPIGRYKVTLQVDGKQLGEQDIDVGIGAKANLTFDLSGPERVEVVGARGAQIDFGNSSSGIEITESELDRLPVARTITDIALLAPGTVEGDSAFTWQGRRLPSFSGSSVAENNYYLNGLSVANFRSGLGGSAVPFEFLKQVQVKTGGYSAEFGRSTGGVLNMIAKTGSNDFGVTINAFWEPDFLIKRQRDLQDSFGEYYSRSTSKDVADERRYNVEVSGPIIEDKLFYYLLLNPRRVSSHTYGSSDSRYMDVNEQWGGTLTWQIHPDHRIEVMGFSDTRDIERQTQSYGLGPEGTLFDQFIVGTLPSLSGVQYKPSVQNTVQGGDNKNVTYYGSFGDSFSIKLMVGENTRSNSTINDDTEPYLDYYYFYKGSTGSRSLGVSKRAGESTLGTQAGTEDINRQTRLDAEWQISDDHQLRFGVDDMKMQTIYNTDYTGGSYHRYYFLNAMDAAPYNYHRWTSYNKGTYNTYADSEYIEDIWQVSSQLTAVLGLRHEVFTNNDAKNETFMKSDDLYAPRLGLTYDVFGDGALKVYGNVGRFFLPIPSNVNADLGGAAYTRSERFTAKCFTWNPQKLPTITCAKADREDLVTANGEPKPKYEIVDQEGLDPMFQDEWTIGLQGKLPWLGDGWLASVEYNNRVMKDFIDDVKYNMGLWRYIQANKISIPESMQCALIGKNFKNANCTRQSYYAMMNPGDPLDIKWDFKDGRGLVPVTLTPDLMQMPKGERLYKGLKFTLDKRWNGQYSLSASYTLSKSEGNTEGAVNSDTGNTLATRTDVFDLEQLMLGAYGPLPNDRRHQFKVFGNYALTDAWYVGANLSWASGRPLSCMGTFTNGEANETRRLGFICDGKISPRGSAGRMPSLTTLSLNTSYQFELFGLDSQISVDVHNPFGWDTETDFVLNKERYLAAQNADGTYPTAPNENYGLPTEVQQGRWGQIKLEVKF